MSKHTYRPGLFLCPRLSNGEPDEPGEDQLVEVFRNGAILRDWKFSEIRQRGENVGLTERAGLIAVGLIGLRF